LQDHQLTLCALGRRPQNLLGRSERAGKQVTAGVKRLLAGRPRLKINNANNAVTSAAGFSVTTSSAAPS
jgi:hypothetical protein